MGDLFSRKERFSWLGQLSPWKSHHKFHQLDSDESSPKVCEQCESLFSSIGSFDALLSAKGYEHLSLEDLKLSAEHGCQLCMRIAKVFSTKDIDALPSPITFRMRAICSFRPSNVDVRNYPSEILAISEILVSPGDFDNPDICSKFVINTLPSKTTVSSYTHLVRC